MQIQGDCETGQGDKGQYEGGGTDALQDVRTHRRIEKGNIMMVWEMFGFIVSSLRQCTVVHSLLHISATAAKRCMHI